MAIGAHYQIKLRDDILPAVAQEIRQRAVWSLRDAGDLFKKRARQECPRSARNDPGYVHLQDTIDYELDANMMDHYSVLTMYVVKDYAIYVNDGTSRMAPRPFFTNGVLAVEDGFDELARNEFHGLILGNAMLPSNALSTDKLGDDVSGISSGALPDNSTANPNGGGSPEEP